jgi:hypothetical protein
MLNALLSLPVLVAVATVAGESSLLAKTFGVRSLDMTSKRHLKELRLERKSVLPLLKKKK